MGMPRTSYTAQGDINPLRFVSPSTTVDFGCIQTTGATLPVLGITDQSTATSNPVTTTLHASTSFPGVTLQNEHNGEKLIVTAGAAVAAGDLLESDANGKAITALTTADTRRFQGYLAVEAAAAEDVVIEVIKIGGFVDYTD